MRILITGGSGLIGRALTESLAADNHEIIILSRSPQKVTGLPEGARAVGWDAKTGAGWVELADGADAIVNLAGANLAGEGFFPARWTAERKRAIRESRLNAGSAVVDAVQQATEKPRVVLQASAIGYYGPRGDETITEGSASGDDFLGRTAVEWEDSTRAVEDMGVRRVITRTGLLLTSKSGALPRLALPFKLFAGGPMGNGQQWYAWIHMEDTIQAMRFLIENESASGPFNLTAPNPVRNAEFARTLGRVMRRPSLVPVPGPAMRLAFGEVATVVLDGQRVLPEQLQSMGFNFNFTHLEPALEDLLS